MKSLLIPQPNISTLFKRNTGSTAVSHNNISTPVSGSPVKRTVPAGEYIINILDEGFKQNFLGADINMEFLTLTVRSYATSTVKAIRKLVAKQAAKQLNTTSTYSTRL